MYSVKPRAHRYSLACFCAGAHYIFIYFIYTLCMGRSKARSHTHNSISSGAALCAWSASGRDASWLVSSGSVTWSAASESWWGAVPS